MIKVWSNRYSWARDAEKISSEYNSCDPTGAIISANPEWNGANRFFDSIARIIVPKSRKSCKQLSLLTICRPSEIAVVPNVGDSLKQSSGNHAHMVRCFQKPINVPTSMKKIKTTRFIKWPNRRTLIQVLPPAIMCTPNMLMHIVTCHAYTFGVHIQCLIAILR